MYAGVCETDITPPPGVSLDGYPGRVKGSKGVHDPLYARALVLDDGARRVAILSADLFAPPLQGAARIRLDIAESLHTTPDSVMLLATHTHGGPNVRSDSGTGGTDTPYDAVLARKLVGIARQAADERRPASITYGEAPCQIGVNRRETLPDGRTVEGRDYGGPVVTRAQALCVNGPDGRLLALLFCHPCRPAAMGADNLHITADWPGAAVNHLKTRFAQEAREAGHDEPALPIFLQGCCADVDPLRQGSWEAVRENGRQVAEAAHAARWSAHLRLSEEVSAAETVLQLPLLPPPPVAECDRLIAEREAATQEAFSRHADMETVLHHSRHPTWAKASRAAALDPDATAFQTFTVQRLTVGGVSLLGFPAALFARHALDFAALSKNPVLSLCFANACHGVLPPAEEYRRGGCEIDEAYKYYGTRMFAPESDRLVREAVARLLADADLP